MVFCASDENNEEIGLLLWCSGGGVVLVLGVPDDKLADIELGRDDFFVVVRASTGL